MPALRLFPLRLQRLPALAAVILLHLFLWQSLIRPLLHQEDTTPLPSTEIHWIKLPPPVTPQTTTPTTRKIPSRAEPLRQAHQTHQTQTDSRSEAPSTITVINEPATDTSAVTKDMSAAPHLDLDALKAGALAADRQRKATTIEQIQNSHKRDNSFEKQLADGTKKAEKKDCRTAYAGIGLLAIIPLAVSAVTDTGCKW